MVEGEGTTARHLTRLSFQVLARGLREPEFRAQLFARPEEALAGYDLSEDERAALLEFTPDVFYTWLGRLCAQRFMPLPVGRRLWIAPVRPDLSPSPGQLWIRLDQRRLDAAIGSDGRVANPPVADRDPNAADVFGSGTHPSTRLCLAALEDYVSVGEWVLDVGTGSGILAIAAGKLGAGRVLALDVDPIAVQAARQNVTLNTLDHVIQVERGSIEQLASISPHRFRAGCVVGNLTQSVILQILQDGLPHAIRRDGILILSGFSDSHADEIAEALAACGLVELERRTSDGWSALIALSPSVD